MDPEEVRRFAEELKRFNSDLQDRVVSLQAEAATQCERFLSLVRLDQSSAK